MHRILVFLLLLAPAAFAEAIDRPAPVTDDAYSPVRLEEAELGQFLFYDPILSGNREVACATCHHPDLGTSDGLSLGIGDGGRGLGPDRTFDPENLPEERIPRNATALFNLGATEFTVLFHDGRIEADPTRETGLRTPMGPDMEAGFASVLSAQTMFPVLSADEMAGHYSENEVAQATRQGFITGPGGAWDLLSRRIAAIPDYASRFERVYGLAPDEIHFTDISNAIAAFVAFEWRSDQAPFDAWLRDEADLPAEALQGAALFYGDAGCGGCHTGPFLTDHDFHAMGEMQIGPGKKARFESHFRDVGRMGVTGAAADAYAFRTPSLRNVATTGPYGHAGAYRDLAAYIRHHANPVAAIATYDRTQARLVEPGEEDWHILQDEAELAAIADAVGVAPVTLSDADVAALVAFLDTLTDPTMADGRLGVPDSVPSGLAVPTP
ncbi:cytochrome-c peroxidase [Pelagovum pacificum]|uniref:Cytochrome-c peroxidase n=1 Tax=Pelagovum pacificum TaxID=2588711 RepID=A0A5C5GCJ4_9RHOB|nr:cytochrome c peroxidase [Pelagovum pacificum]QQA44368.1 cytochrome-c peroxidase [Pelagovum pacificum]TNY32515.1 cytochrome-c peroxidase [Pelagovum pacificum]